MNRQRISIPLWECTIQIPHLGIEYVVHVPRYEHHDDVDLCLCRFWGISKKIKRFMPDLLLLLLLLALQMLQQYPPVFSTWLMSHVKAVHCTVFTYRRTTSITTTEVIRYRLLRETFVAEYGLSFLTWHWHSSNESVLACTTAHSHTLDGIETPNYIVSCRLQIAVNFTLREHFLRLFCLCNNEQYRNGRMQLWCRKCLDDFRIELILSFGMAHVEYRLRHSREFRALSLLVQSVKFVWHFTWFFVRYTFTTLLSVVCVCGLFCRFGVDYSIQQHIGHDQMSHKPQILW